MRYIGCDSTWLPWTQLEDHIHLHRRSEAEPQETALLGQHAVELPWARSGNEQKMERQAIQEVGCKSVMEEPQCLWLLRRQITSILSAQKNSWLVLWQLLGQGALTVDDIPGWFPSMLLMSYSVPWSGKCEEGGGKSAPEPPLSLEGPAFLISF